MHTHVPLLHIIDLYGESFYKEDNHSFKKLLISMYFVALKWGKPVPRMLCLCFQQNLAHLPPCLSLLCPHQPSPWDSWALCLTLTLLPTYDLSSVFTMSN